MKTLLIILFSIAIITTETVQENDLIGIYDIFEFEVINNNDSNKTTQSQLEENNSVWELAIMEDGKIKQSSNMHSGTLESQKGTWKSSKNNLTFQLQLDNREIELIYTYELKNNILVLTRSNPSGTMKIISKFKRK